MNALSKNNQRSVVHANDFSRLWDDIGKETLAAVERVGRSGWFILGKEVEQFQKAFAGWWGLPHCVGVANGMDAIEIGLRSLDLKVGERVLTTPLSAFATTAAIIRAGGVPVFVDTDANGLIDLERCESFFKKNADVKFFVPVHLYGHSLDLNRLEALKNAFDLKIVEDSAQAHGAKFDGRMNGSVGQVCVTSFYPTKNVGAIGDAGALLCRDDEINKKARSLRDYGQSRKYLHDMLGLNSRLDELQAAILHDAVLTRIDRWNARRTQVAARYLAQIQHAEMRMFEDTALSQPCWHLFPVFVAADKRASLIAHLEGEGVMAGIHYPHLISDQKALTENTRADVKFECADGLELARSIANTEVSLPIHPYLKDEEVERVVAACNSWKANG